MDINIEFYKDLIHNLYDGVYFVDRQRKIIYWNEGAEKLTGYSADEVVGLHCHDNLLAHVTTSGEAMCTSLCPLAHTMMDGQPREQDAFLRHQEGHRVPVRVRTQPIAGPGGEIIGAVEIFSDNSPAVQAKQRIESLEKLAMLDALTHLANRRFLESSLNSRLEELRRQKWQSGLLFMDIDNFKSINDTWGHEIGDRVLTMVAKTISAHIRVFDVCGRWGGEEFIVLVTNTDEATLRVIAERQRQLVASSTLTHEEGVLRVTVSVGATMIRAEDTVETVVARADKLMYDSKRAGKNRTTFG